MKKLRRLISAAIMLFVLTIGASAADFIFEANENMVMPLSVEDSGYEPLGFGLYTADDEEELKRMLELGIINSYEPNYEVYLMDETNDTHFNSTQKTYEYALTNAVGAVNNGLYNGKGVKVAIIDSGMTVLTDTPKNVIIKENIINSELTCDDEASHGTGVAGVIAAQTNNSVGPASLAPEADIVILKVFDSKTSSTDTIIKAIKRAVELKCDVINMSLGTSKNSNSMKTAINEAVASGAIVVAAAGNHTSDNADKPLVNSPAMYPAYYDNVISVASVTLDKLRSDFSYHNDKVNISACGDKVLTLSTKYLGGYSYSSGTSFSAPFVSAVAALVKQIKPEITSAEFLELLQRTALPAAEPDNGASYSTYYGAGIVNVGGILDELLGKNITVGEAYLPDGTKTPNALIRNDSFDSYEVTDIWLMEYNGEQSYIRRKKITLPARTELTLTPVNEDVEGDSYIYQRHTVLKHMVWFPDSLIPIGKRTTIGG